MVCGSFRSATSQFSSNFQIFCEILIENTQTRRRSDTAGTETAGSLHRIGIGHGRPVRVSVVLQAADAQITEGEVSRIRVDETVGSAAVKIEGV